MTQPIDVAFVEVRFDTSNSSANLKKEVDKAFTEVDKSAEQVSANISKEFDAAGEHIVKTFRDANGRLRDENGRFVKEGLAGLREFETGAQNTGDEIGSIFQRIKSQVKEAFGDASDALKPLGDVVGVIQSAAGPVGAIVTAFALLAAGAELAAVAVQGVIIAAAGLALLPGIILSAVGAFGILAAATSGVGAAFKELEKQQQKQKAGGGVNTAIQQASNQRQLANAIRGVTQAEHDLAKARQEALRDIERLNVALEKSRASQLRSADDLAKAEKLLNDTRKVGTPEQIKEATIAYEEAKAALDGNIQTTKELEQDKKKADKNGVEGSDKVLAALERLRDAQDQVKSSQEAITRGSGAMAASGLVAFNSLSKSAQGFVKAIFDAKNALGPLQDKIQEAFFKGTGELVPGITKNIQSLQGPILDVTKAFNEAFKGLLKFLASAEFKDAAGSALKSLADFVRAIGPGVKDLVLGFTGLAGQLGKTGKNGKTLGTTLGESLGGALKNIGDFLKNVDLEKVIEDAKTAFNELKPLLKATFDLVKELFRFFEEHGPGIIEFFTPLIEKISTAISVFTDLGIAFDNFILTLQDGFLVAQTAASAFFIFLKEKWNGFVADLKAIPGKIVELGGRMKDAGKALIKSFFDGLAAGGAFVGEFAKKIANAVIRVFNDNIGKAINDAIDNIQNGLNKIPGVNVHFPNFPRIPELESGGLTTGDTLARIGEKGKQEAVLPLENPRAMAAIANAISKASAEQSNGVVFGPGSIVLNFEGNMPSEMEAFRAGQAVGAGIASTLTRQGVRTRIRTLGTRNG